MDEEGRLEGLVDDEGGAGEVALHRGARARIAVGGDTFHDGGFSGIEHSVGLEFFEQILGQDFPPELPLPPHPEVA